MDRQDKMINDIVLDGEPHRLDGVQHAIEEELKSF